MYMRDNMPQSLLLTNRAYPLPFEAHIKAF